MNAVTESEVKAYHEAGHAFGFHAAGIPVKSLELDKCTLSCEYEQKLNQAQVTEIVKRETLLQRAIACCCGKASVDRWYGYRMQEEPNWKASDDHAQAFSCALQLSDGDHTAAEFLVSYAMRMAELLVEKNWSQISRLSFELLERNKLSGPEIWHLMKFNGSRLESSKVSQWRS